MGFFRKTYLAAALAAIAIMLPWHGAAHSTADETADTTIMVGSVEVTAIKQGRVLRSEPVASTIVGSRDISRNKISALKNLSQTVPNLHIPDYGSRMTSSIYVRGLGARIDQPVMGMNVDNVPVLNKNLFDTELADIERIEVLRGPQSTLYGRNTMGGVVNVYTLSPLRYEGVRLRAEYGSGQTWSLRASAYRRFNNDLGLSVTGFYNSSDGFFENLATGEKCDRERMGGGRFRVQWQGRDGWTIDNTLSFSILEQGGYPYMYIGEDKEFIKNGEIRYNDPAGYERTALSNGLTLRHDGEKFTFSSITSYQYSDDCMTLDQDFLPLSYFTLRQAVREHAVTEDIVFRSRGTKRYSWIAGAFAFYRHGTMSAPVDFKKTGIGELIFKNANQQMAGMGIRYTQLEDELHLASDFRNPVAGAALYHESQLRLGRWRLTAGIRVDYERTKLQYHSQAAMTYGISYREAPMETVEIAIDESNAMAHSYVEVLPKIAAIYSFDEMRNIYLTIAKGYKAGGFNTQMFSDILQEKLKWQMVSSLDYREGDIMSYRPEHSWNFEMGGHFSCLDGCVRGDVALFWIECRDQQLTVFPAGQSTGRMMTNAGRTRSRGAEVSVMATPWRSLELHASYGLTDARFRSYDDGMSDYAGKRLPYAPKHTLSARAVWSHATGVKWLGDILLMAGIRSAGDIFWNEANTLSQPFYTLVEASIRFEHPNYSLDIWGHNLADASYNVFYFKSIGNEFVQQGRPRTFGITLSLNILEP